MKLLVAASAVDLDFRYGCTPAWWQLWKGLYEEGVDLVVTPYRGRAVESPWWRTAPNPTFVEGESFARARDVVARLKGDSYLRRAEDNPEDGLGERMTREAIWRWVTPRWRKHLDALVRDERPDALVVFTVPMAHLRGIPSYLRERYGLPIVFYDGDVPMSLPEFGGMDTGFNWYHQADPSEYDLVVSNSEGGLERLRELGARRAEAVFWGADPDFFAPREVEKQMDVFFYGYGDKFRREWMQTLVGDPSRAMPDVDFALGGRDFQGDVGTRTPDRRRPVQRIRRRYLRSACQPLHHAPLPRNRLRIVLLPPVRARVRGCGDRREPLQRHRAVVRARSRDRHRRESAAGDRRLSRSARRRGSGGGVGPSCARACPRRAHLSTSRTSAARADRVAVRG